MDAPMYIHGLKIENYLRLELVELAFDGPGLTQITGRNMQGKSSILNAIRAMGGAKSIPELPVRRGAERGNITIQLTDKTVKIKVKPDGTATVSVEGQDGAVYRRPQELLASFIGDFAFEPLELLRLKPAERLAKICKLCGIDTVDDDAERKRLYDERTIVNREHKQLKDQLVGLEVQDAPGAAPEPATLPERIVVSELAEQHQAAVATQRHHDGIRAKRDSVMQEVRDSEAEVARMREALAQAEADLATNRAAWAKLGEEVAALVDPDLAGIATALKTAEARNAEIAGLERAEAARQRAHRDLVAAHTRATATRAAKAAEVQTKAAEADRLTDAIMSIDTAKAARLAAIAFPVAGMGLGEGDVTFNGIPFAQCSSAERLRMCLATGAALNPRLRVLLVEQGNDLDQDALRQVAEWARDNQYEVIMERVAGETPVGVVIEAGRVAADLRTPQGC